jgi:protein-S-isoprenylcysteine O-methyltransferase Ste14
LLFLPVIANAWVSEIVAVVLATIAYSIRIPREEQALIQAFGEEYIAYRRSVPCLLPLRRKTK